ncbi:hypothetical protein WJX74_009322 [Apatococcus lobatus]|uniref:Guanylate cyclase domain-containing protein n=1 Tax=Apatococcus lobatus TaxID=904363 RepID=A0AAW1RW07_9CHLO
METGNSGPKRSVSFSSSMRQPSFARSKSLGKVLHFDDQSGPIGSAGSYSKQPLIARSPSMSRPSIIRKMSMRKGDRTSMGLNSRDSAAAAVHMADKALAAFVIIQAALKRSPRLQRYSQRQDLNERMPDFQVKMGFGLHIGWAIEGAIGSNFKIDASYLSPNVNMASRLEAATKQFGTSILLSEDFVAMLSPRVRLRVRQIDRVTVKGSAKPMGLFTYDVSLDKVAAPMTEPSVRMPAGLMLPDRTADTAQAETFSAQVYNDEFAEHPDLKVTWAVDAAFIERFAEGYTAYETGEWARARFILEETQASRRDVKGEPVKDGPSTALLNFMTDKGFQAPPGWKGWRELTEK